MDKRSFLAAIFLFIPGSGAVAQEQALIPRAGARVRITVSCEPAGDPKGRTAGRECSSPGALVRLSGDTVEVSQAGSMVRYDLNTLRRFEVSRGRKSSSLVGAGVGAMVGAGATFLVLNSGGSTSLCNSSENQDAAGGGECLAMTALGAVAGAGLGALVGARIRTERWQNIPVERLRVRLAPQPGRRLNLSLAMAF